MATPKRRKAGRADWGKVRKLPSGRFQASYLGPDQRRYNAPMTFTAEIDARTWLRAQRRAIETSDWTTATPSATAAAQVERANSLDDYARAWIDARTGPSGAALRESTRHGYLALLAGPIAPLASTSVAQISPAKVRAWYSDLVRTGRKTTASRAYGLLRSVLQTAVLDGLLPVNPCSIRGAQNARTGRKAEPLMEAELAIIEATMPDHLRAAVTIAAWGALRYGELTELRRGDIIEREDQVFIRVERAVTSVPGKGFIIGQPKSEAGVRTIALPPQVTGVVRDHLTLYAAPGADGLLFPSRNDAERHLAESTFVKSWYPARAAAGREDLPWHSLRHFGLTRLALAGATTKELMAWAGHTTPSIAMRYQHTAGRETELAACMMDS